MLILDSRRKFINYAALPFNPNLKERARELRKAGNLCEIIMWRQFHKGNFKAYDFDRQKIIGNYIVDFFCVNCLCVIEIDGSSHNGKEEYDEERDAFFKSLGLNVIHIKAADVLHNLSGVMKMLREHHDLSELRFA
ncbi:MAG: DUF559 domain-containing protein [Oscillospiraceae bacterium]|nr:DUF559 domain-containing protein [Oscillospiraceae bacterium]